MADRPKRPAAARYAHVTRHNLFIAIPNL